MDPATPRYAIFRTRWGHFGFACRAESICATSLPAPTRTAAREALLANLPADAAEARSQKELRLDLQRRIIAYFEGENVDFSTDPAVDLSHYSPFGQAIMASCRQISFGQTRTYGELARQAGRPAAARAVGGTMARNPFPLLVPCHRVVRTAGGLGGFSAIGGTATKRRMLLHEQAAVGIPMPPGHAW
ncbi:MAG: methylated-DNA--[protein]-cysteine S-methyltransferase [Phycisphaerales bacterium]|nr:MAG: methylated-DNA--[protein]-cysteine S-methyltransferase [Phycisphaerales bacterium]